MSVGGDMGRNTVFGEHIKNNRHDGVMDRDKDHLLSKLVDYDQDSIKLRK